jgi:hypothetical protein
MIMEDSSNAQDGVLKNHLHCSYEPGADQNEDDIMDYQYSEVIDSAMNMTPELVKMMGWDDYDQLLTTLNKAFSLYE